MLGTGTVDDSYQPVDERGGAPAVHGETPSVHVATPASSTASSAVNASVAGVIPTVHRREDD
jgi:hypothetical protein